MRNLGQTSDVISVKWYYDISQEHKNAMHMDRYVLGPYIKRKFQERERIQNNNYPDNKAHGVNMGPTWGRQDPDGPHIGPMNFAIWVII